MLVFVIKQLRESKNISRYRLAKMTGLSKSYIIDLEKNRKVNPTIKTLNLIADALGVNVKELFYSHIEIDLLKQELYRRMDKYGTTSKEALEISQIIDLLVNINMGK